MKGKHLLRLIAVILLVGASLISCKKAPVIDTRFDSLFRKTDYFVRMLETTYDHYDAFGKYAEDSSDGKYTVTPIGRLIVVKKKTFNTDASYKEIATALSARYLGDRRVKKCFENESGTVTIDCRK